MEPFRHQLRNQVSNSETHHEIDLTLKGQLSLFLTGVPHRGGDPSGEDTWSEGSWPGDHFCQTTIDRERLIRIWKDLCKA